MNSELRRLDTQDKRVFGGAADLPELRDREFERIVKRVLETTGIVLQEHKRVLVRSRISKRLKELGLNTFDAYLDFIDSPAGEDEVIEFCNAITTNLTSFFREEHHFEDLAERLGGTAFSSDSRLRIWSAGCSTGEEPYSIAMTMLNCNALKQVSDKKILASDIDTGVLKKGEAGVYRGTVKDTLPSNCQEYARDAQDKKSFEVSPQVRELISFRRLNLFTEWPFSGQFDYIFCRNVMIYFSTENKNMLVDKFVQALKPNGMLYLGHSETLMQAHPNLQAAGRTTFRRV